MPTTTPKQTVSEYAASEAYKFDGQADRADTVAMNYRISARASDDHAEKQELSALAVVANVRARALHKQADDMRRIARLAVA